MNNKNLSESDLCDKVIRPAIVQAGWHTLDQIYAQYPLRAGRVVVRGKTAKRDQSTVLFADFALFLKPNIPLAVVEAKKSRLSVQAGMQQAINYAELLDVPFSFASNGECFVFRDATLATGVLEQNITLEQFPSPQELWARYCAWKGWSPEVQRVAAFDYSPSKTPRYYQLNAINRAVEAIANGQNRVLLVMATGTGKTYTAFQIIWRLWKSGAKKRILFLADRNILIDQTMVNDFRPFKGAMAKLSPNAKGVERVNAQGQIEVEDVDLAVDKTTKQVNKSYEIYLSLYQAVSGTEEEQNIYKQFSPDFFDLIVVDECHRGSANEDSAWRDILTYFSSATHFDLLLDRPEAVDTLEQTILQLAVRGLLVPQDPQDEPASELLKKIRAEKDRLIAESKIKRDKPLPPIAEDEKPFDLPLGWEWVRLGDVANIASNLVQPALHRTAWQVAPDCIEKGTGRILAKRTVAQAEVISANYLFKPGQILYSKIRPSLSKAVLVDFAGLCSADMYPIETSLDSQYLLMFILSQPFLGQVSIAENRVKMPKLNQEALVVFSVALPSLAEQSRIVARVASLRALCADLRQRLATARTQQALLAEVLVAAES